MYSHTWSKYISFSTMKTKKDTNNHKSIFKYVSHWGKNKTWHPRYCYWVQILKKYTYFPLLVYLFDNISTFLHKKSGHSGFVAEQLLSIWCVRIDHVINEFIRDWVNFMVGKRAIVKRNLLSERLETSSEENQNYFL